MNFDELQKAWSAQTVKGTPPAASALRDALVAEVRLRSSAIRRVIGVAAFAFVMGWAVALAAHLTGIKPLNGVTLSGFIAVSVFEIGCLLAAVRSLRRTHRQALSMGETLVESLGSSLQAVEWQMEDYVRLGYAVALGWAGAIALTAIKVATGNLPTIAFWVQMAGATVLAGGIALTLRSHYRRTLAPRRDELRRHLAELGR